MAKTKSMQLKKEQPEGVTHREQKIIELTENETTSVTRETSIAQLKKNIATLKEQRDRIQAQIDECEVDLNSAELTVPQT